MKSAVSRTARPSFAALAIITGTTALSTDTYIAALPEIQYTLHTTAFVAQLTMTACIAGMAIGQLLSGPISDEKGRRGLILAATAVFAALSIVCAVSTTGWLLVAARAVQGLACGAAAAVGRAVVTDYWEGREAAAKFGTLSAIGLIAPVAGPAIGGVLLSVSTWRTVFWFLTVVGIVMLLAAIFGLPETLPADRRQPGGLKDLARRTRELLADQHFRNPVLVQCLTVGGFFVYIGGSSLVLQSDLGVSQNLYSIIFATAAIAMMLSSVAYRVLVFRLGAHVLRDVAIIIQTLSVVLLFAAVLISPQFQPSLPIVWGCLCGMTIGLGTYLPANSAIVQTQGRRYGGTASALGGGIPFLVGAIMTPLTGLIGTQTVYVMATAMLAFFSAAAIVAVLSTLTARRHTRAENSQPSPTAMSA